MKHLKYFENNSEPQIGDYVLVDIDIKPYLDLTDNLINTAKKLNTSISRITNFDRGHMYKLNNYWWASKSDITHWSPNKEELEPILNAKKYNI